MNYLKYLFYGLIQGFTEFLPISSTAHLKVISSLFGVEDPGSSISAILQIGSVLAILYYFKKDIFLLFKSNSDKFNKSIFNKKLLNSIYLGTLPIIFLGVIIKIFVPNFSDSILRSYLSIALISILMAIIMLFSEKSKKASISVSNHNLIDGFKIGLGQALAIIPGVSRAGITISIALLLGWNRKDATRFSFLLGIPAISIAAIVELLDAFRGNITIFIGPLFLSLVITFFVSIFSIDFLIKYVPDRGLKGFAYYRIIFGTVILSSLLLN